MFRSNIHKRTICYDSKIVLARHNYELAKFKLCEKMGWMSEYWRFCRHCDVDAYGTEEKKNFCRKVVRFLAFNYKIHACPDWLDEPRLWPMTREGALPIVYPPEYL